MTSEFRTLIYSIVFCIAALLSVPYDLHAQEFVYNAENSDKHVQQKYSVLSCKEISDNLIEVSFSNDQKVLFDFYGETSFDFFRTILEKECGIPKQVLSHKY